MEVIKVTSKNNKHASSQELLLGVKDGNKRTALHFAAAKGRRKMIDYILSVAPEYVFD